MSKQPAPPSVSEAALPWDRRPVTARDMAIVAGVMVFTCIAGVALTLFALAGQPRVQGAAQSVVNAPPEAAPVVSAGAMTEQITRSPAAVAAGAALFSEQCAACHTVGGGVLVGPDLEGVAARRDGDWLTRWIAEPDVMLAEGDPLAVSLLEEFNNIPMPNLRLSPSQVRDVLAYLQNPEGGASAAVLASQLPEGNAASGRALFTGAVSLQNGGPACMSCHTTAGAGPLGGGTLGPDLTHVFQRYGEAGLPTTLQNLPFPTMQGVFGPRPLTDREAANLYAYFVQIDQAAAEGADDAFVVMGLVVFAVLLLSSQLLWRRRLKAVRKPLLGGAQ